MEVKFRSLTYDEARAEHFEVLKNKAKRKMILWAARIDRSRPNNLVDPAHIKASEFGKEYNFYKDALDALAAAPKWISVEERLPEEKTAVLAFGQRYVFNGKKIETWSMAHVAYTRGEEEGWFSWDSEDVISVTHWMPLPSTEGLNDT